MSRTAKPSESNSVHWGAIMSKRDELGRIDCPTCGLAAGMRITQDKNGEPFGFCDGGCNQQIRIGGSSYRVKQFLTRYPWAAGVQAAPAVPVTVTDTAEKAPPKPTKPPKPDAAPEPLPIPKRKGTGNALLDLIQGI